MISVIETSNQFGVLPTPQRIAVAQFVVSADRHPAAEKAWPQFRANCPTLSQATVPSTLNLLAEKGVPKLPPRKRGVAFDSHVAPRHDGVDLRTERDVRGFVVTLCTDEGDWILAVSHTPVFFVRDPYKCFDFIHTEKQGPKSNPRSETAMRDFWSV